MYEADSKAPWDLKPSTESPSHIIAPGFVDVHIHGYNGVDFMSASSAELLRMADGLEAEGYEAFLPTTVSASAEAVLSALAQLPEHPAIAGFHLEGPFISPKHPGAQPIDALEAIPEGSSAWDAVFDHPKLKWITLAPELAGAEGLINRLKGRGAVVSMGHSDATCAQVGDAVSWGASHVTHLFNAMRPFHHRSVGLAGAALTDERVSVEIIADRKHLDKRAVQLVLAAKPSNTMAVSDGTAAAGLPKGTKLSMWGHDVVVGEGDVRLMDGGLAGSAVTLRQIFKYLVEDFDALIAAWACCILPRLKLVGAGSPVPKVHLIFDAEGELVEIVRRQVD